MDTDADLDEDLAEVVATAVIASAGHEGHILDGSVVKRFVRDDSVYQLLSVSAADLHQHKSHEIPCLRPFYGMKDRLAVQQDLVTYTFDQGCVRLVIPEHAAEGKAVSILDWIGRELAALQSILHITRDTPPRSPGEQSLSGHTSEYPFQSTVADMFQHEGHTYMACADRLTGWLELAHFPCGATSQRIKTRLISYFTGWDAPEQLSTDGGTNLTSKEMTEFLKNWTLRHAYHHHSILSPTGELEQLPKRPKR